MVSVLEDRREIVEKRSIIWFLNVLRLREFRSFLRVFRRKKEFMASLGYCPVGKGVALMSYISGYALFFHDVVIRKNDDGSLECNNGAWCFNLRCPLNRASVDAMSFFGHKFLSRYDVEMYHKILEGVRHQIEGIYGEEMFKEKPTPSVYNFLDEPVVEVNLYYATKKIRWRLKK